MAVVIYYRRSDLLCMVFLVWRGGLSSGTCKRGRQKGVSLICSDTPLRLISGLRSAIVMERIGGVAAIVCNTTENIVRQGLCDGCQTR